MKKSTYFLQLLKSDKKLLNVVFRGGGGFKSSRDRIFQIYMRFFFAISKNTDIENQKRPLAEKRFSRALCNFKFKKYLYWIFFKKLNIKRSSKECIQIHWICHIFLVGASVHYRCQF